MNQTATYRAAWAIATRLSDRRVRPTPTLLRVLLDALAVPATYIEVRLASRGARFLAGEPLAPNPFKPSGAREGT